MKIEPGEDIWTWTVTSDRTHEEYTVCLVENGGQGQCDCENWRFRVAPLIERGGQASCKHVQACRLRLAMEVIGRQVEMTKPASVTQTAYAAMREKFLSDHRSCGVCRRLADDVHHSRGRMGDLLTDRRWWVPVCRVCHDWVHSNLDAARKLSWEGVPVLCQRGDWNRSPEE